MGDHHIAEPSLLLARHDTAQREHHQHNHFHRQLATEVRSVVTEAVVTISVVQQINVDTAGNTLGLQTFLADSTGGITRPIVTLGGSAPSATISQSPSPAVTGQPSASSTAQPTGAAGEAANNAASKPSSSSIQGVATPTLSIPPTFSSLLPISNSTASIASSNSRIPNFSNSSSLSSTLSSASRSSLLFSIASISASSEVSSTSSVFSVSATSSTSSFYSSSSSQLLTPTGIIPIAGTGAGNGNSPTNTAPAVLDASADGTTPSTPVVVGGVVGGVAGVAVLILAMIFFIRWKKRNQSMLALGEGEGPASTARALPTSQPPGGMVERSSRLSNAFAVPAALASLTGFNRSSRHSNTDRTISSTAGSERGFYRVSGRKLPSVLQNGGDGYGGGIMESNTLSGSSFYRDSQGFYGGPGGASSPPAGLSMQRDSGVPVMREGPARTPVTEHSPFADPAPLPPPRRPDQVGRSHPSLDGSQRSRFTEEV